MNPQSTWADISRNQIRENVATEVYFQGLRLIKHKQVIIVELTPTIATMQVRSGYHSFEVALELAEGDYIYGGCNCSKGRSGSLCAHVVAVLLTAREHLTQEAEEMQQIPSWRDRLQQWVSTVKPVHKKAAIALFSLQREEYSYYTYSDQWRLKPYYVAINPLIERGIEQEAIFDPDQLDVILRHHDLTTWIKEISGTGTLNRLQLANTSSVPQALLAFMFGGDMPAYMRSYGTSDMLSSHLQLLAEEPSALLYLGDQESPLQQRLSLASEPVTIQFHMTTTSEEGLEITTQLPFGSKATSGVYDDLQVLTNNPDWVMFDDRQVFRLDSVMPVEQFVSLLREPAMVIPPEEREEFLNESLPNLAQIFPFTGIELDWRTYKAETITPRLYLSEIEGKLQAQLRFGYDDYEVIYEKSLPPESVMRKPDSFTLVRVQRQSEQEHELFRSVSKFGLKRGPVWGIFVLRKNVEPVDFLIRHVPRLTAAGFEIFGEESIKSVRVNRQQPTISFNISSGIDWFDVQAVVKFGDVEASIKELRRAVRRKERFIKLADGSIGEIPEEWLKQYRRLFAVSETTEDDQFRFDAHHLTLLDQLLGEANDVHADAEFKASLQRLRDFSGIEAKALPQGFLGELRPYQQAGYNWLHFLHEYDFGGCLADDMGLGKTVQVLVFLQSLRESGHARAADLIVVPKSLLVNWEREAARFTPDLRVLIHSGQTRTKDPSLFADFDMVLTTYGIALRDLEMLRSYQFHYVALDESQAVKNPVAKTSRAVRMLASDHRLVLTGTPIENTTLELWSQFAFLNPGLLGNLDFFRQDFANPIERNQDEDAAGILRKTVFPFILRRTKQQVAPELPPRVERILYCDMEPAQRKLYERWRDYYRGVVLGMIEEEGGQNVHMKILEGLLRLRQIAIHPRLVDEKFRGKSSKFELLLETLETLEGEDHKALVFSQFVKVLQNVRQELDQREISYEYLDGRTRKRQERVDQFQSDPDISFFLISLKAGGVGLNLTAADYVIHIDPWWNPAVEMQASDRVHRIGQDKPVFIFKIITRDTVEEKILVLQERKRHLVEQVISTEGSFFKSLTNEDVQVLFS